MMVYGIYVYTHGCSRIYNSTEKHDAAQCQVIILTYIIYTIKTYMIPYIYGWYTYIYISIAIVLSIGRYIVAYYYMYTIYISIYIIICIYVANT